MTIKLGQPNSSSLTGREANPSHLLQVERERERERERGSDKEREGEERKEGKEMWRRREREISRGKGWIFNFGFILVASKTVGYGP